MFWPTHIQLIRYAVVLLIAALGGFAFQQLGTPMPYLLGGFIATGIASVAGLQVMGGPLEFPKHLRTVFIVVIGVLIGGAIGGDILGELSKSLPSFFAVLVFVVASQAGNYMILRKVGGYDRPTAYFSGTPGGLIESLALGEAAGADARILTVQQFARVAIVISLVPLIVSLWHGSAVGSASGQSLASDAAAITPRDWLILIATGAVGYGVARMFKLPAGMLTGPIIASAVVHIAGLTDASPPEFLINVSQWIIGASLGMRFVGLDRATLTKALWLAVLCCAFMFALGFVLAVMLA